MAISPLHRLLTAACLLALGLAAPAPLLAQEPSEPLELHFLDVGQGDATLIKLGRLGVLVDAGRGDDIVQVLAEEGIDSLVAAIASHNHDDHIGGMDAVVADWSIGRYLYNGRKAANQNAQAVESWLEKKGTAVPLPPWEPIELGDARITVFPSPLDPSHVSENNSSLGVLVERGAFRALLTGDSEYEEINAWLEAGVIPNVDVLKAAHHGARNGVTPGWLLVTRPEVVVISVGRNSYGHPSPWALRYYNLANRQVLRTDRDGTVIISVDSAGIYHVHTTTPVVRE